MRSHLSRILDIFSSFLRNSSVVHSLNLLASSCMPFIASTKSFLVLYQEQKSRKYIVILLYSKFLTLFVYRRGFDFIDDVEKERRNY